MSQERNNVFMMMTTKKLIKTLKEYALERSGEISDLTYAAAVRLGVLDARVKVLQKEEDDLK